MYIKLPMYMFFLWHLDFFVRQIHYLGYWKWCALKISIFPIHLLPFQSPKKSRFLGPIPSNGPCNGFARIKIIKSLRHINNWSINTTLELSYCFLSSQLCYLSKLLKLKMKKLLTKKFQFQIGVICF
jgi:hypothetical protein